MNKIKMTFMALAILLSVGGALATRPHHTGDSVWYWNGNTYIPAGSYMQDYICMSSPNTCTYSFDGATYTPYQQGNYAPFPGGITNEAKTTKETKKK
jgi:hypothetical protein